MGCRPRFGAAAIAAIAAIMAKAIHPFNHPESTQLGDGGSFGSAYGTNQIQISSTRPPHVQSKASVFNRLSVGLQHELLPFKGVTILARQLVGGWQVNSRILVVAMGVVTAPKRRPYICQLRS